MSRKSFPGQIRSTRNLRNLIRRLKRSASTVVGRSKMMKDLDWFLKSCMRFELCTFAEGVSWCCIPSVHRELPVSHKKSKLFVVPLHLSRGRLIHVTCFAALSLVGINICRGLSLGLRRSLSKRSSHWSSQDCQQFPPARSETPKVYTRS